MESLMAKWKNTIDTQKERQRSVGKAKPKDPEATESDHIKIQTQRIIDLLMPNQDPPPSIPYSVLIFQQVCEVLQRLVQRSKNSVKIEKSSETHKNESEFEAKVNEIEREKVRKIQIYLRRENQELKKKNEELQERLIQSSLSQDLISLLKDSQAKLFEANKLLTDDIRLLKQSQIDKDKLWELELQDIKKALSTQTPI